MASRYKLMRLAMIPPNLVRVLLMGAPKSASVAGKKPPNFLTSYAIILRPILGVFFSRIINGLQTLRIK